MKPTSYHNKTDKQLTKCTHKNKQNEQNSINNLPVCWLIHTELMTV